MKNNLLYEFVVNKKDNTITVKREFAAAVSLVWEAWTNPEILDQWWASDGWQSQTKSMDFRINGFRHYLMKGPKGEEHWGLTTYNNIEVNLFFAGLECFSDENAVINNELMPSNYTIQFAEYGKNTLITHVTTYNMLEDLEASLKYGFEDGTIGAYTRLDNIISNHSKLAN